MPLLGQDLFLDLSILILAYLDQIALFTDDGAFTFLKLLSCLLGLSLLVKNRKVR